MTTSKPQSDFSPTEIEELRTLTDLTAVRALCGPGRSEAPRGASAGVHGRLQVARLLRSRPVRLDGAVTPTA